jgi:hypothetical protein
MKKRILFLAAVLVIGIGAWIVSVSSRSKVAHHTALPSETAGIPRQQEPVGWVFGRLVGVQQSVGAPSGPGVPFQGSRLPHQHPMPSQP